MDEWPRRSEALPEYLPGRSGTPKAPVLWNPVNGVLTGMAVCSVVPQLIQEIGLKQRMMATEQN